MTRSLTDEDIERMLTSLETIETSIERLVTYRVQLTEPNTKQTMTRRIWSNSDS